MSGESFSNDKFQKALGDSLRDFPHMTGLKAEQERCIKSTAGKHDVFGILPTGSQIASVRPLFLRATRGERQCIFTQSLHSRIPRALPSKRKIKVCWQSTGFGKSLIFSNSLSRPQRAVEDEKNDRLLVTPLVSIMKEQVEEMKRLGLKVFAIGLGEQEAEKERRATSCEVDIIYGSPESWCDPIWSKELEDGQLGTQTVCLVVDEAHAVSAW